MNFNSQYNFKSECNKLQQSTYREEQDELVCETNFGEARYNPDNKQIEIQSPDRISNPDTHTKLKNISEFRSDDFNTRLKISTQDGDQVKLLALDNR